MMPFQLKSARAPEHEVFSKTSPYEGTVLLLEDRLSVLHSLKRLQGAAIIPGQATSTPRQGAPQSSEHPRAGRIPEQAAPRGREHPRGGEHPGVMNIPRQGASRGREHPGAPTRGVPPFPAPRYLSARHTSTPRLAPQHRKSAG